MNLIGPFHPQIVHFPIVLLILSLLFDLVGRATDSAWWRKASLALLVVAVVAGVAGVLTGEFVSDKAEEVQRIPEATIDAHGDAGKIATWLASGALVARLVESGAGPARAAVSVVALLLQLFAASAVSVAGYRGGKLVYEHGAGVRIGGQLIKQPGAGPTAGEGAAPTATEAAQPANAAEHEAEAKEHEGK